MIRSSQRNRSRSQASTDKDAFLSISGALHELTCIKLQLDQLFEDEVGETVDLKEVLAEVCANHSSSSIEILSPLPCLFINRTRITALFDTLLLGCQYFEDFSVCRCLYIECRGRLNTWEFTVRTLKRGTSFKVTRKRIPQWFETTHAIVKFYYGQMRLLEKSKSIKGIHFTLPNNVTISHRML